MDAKLYFALFLSNPFSRLLPTRMIKSNPSSGLLARFCSKVVAGHQGRGALVKVNKSKHAGGVRRFRKGFLGRDFRQPYSRHSEGS